MKMKRFIAIVLCLAMVLSMGSISAFAAGTDSGYDYPEKGLWTDSSWFGGFMTYQDILQMNGGLGFDSEIVVNSKLGEAIIGLMKGTFMNTGYDDPKTFTYWAEQGVEKKLFHGEDPNAAFSVFAPAGVTEKMPVIVVFHGGGRNILDAEYYGFVNLCVDNDVIVVCPQHQGMQTADPSLTHGQMVENLLKEMETNGYAIDYTRIYATGHSAGGMATFNAALERPDLIAAIAPAGCTSLALAKTAADYPDAEIPMYFMMGEYDYDQLPMTQPPVDGARVSWDPQALVDNINYILDMNNCATDLSLEACRKLMAEGSDEVCNFLGIYGDKNYTETVYDDTRYYAEFLNKDGKAVLIVEGVSELPHWMDPALAENAWEFLTQFTRSEEEAARLNTSDMTYVVVKGDSLWSIAAKHLGAGYKWETIFEANKSIISNPNLIFVGQKLTIPGTKPAPVPVPTPTPAPEPEPTPEVPEYSAEITWADPVIGEVTGTLTLDPETETWELYYETAFGPYTLGGWYLTDGTMGITNDGGLGGFLDFAPIEAAASPAIKAMFSEKLSAEITWADPVIGETTGTLTLDPATETWELYYETAFGPYTLGGWYLPDGSMGVTNDGGLGGFLDFAPIEAVASPAIIKLTAKTVSTEITWADPVIGETTGTLTLNTTAETWELYYETAFGPYTLGGWYLADGSMGVTNDGGLGGFLDFAPIEAVASPAIIKLIAKTYSTEITWADPVIGETTGTLTIDANSETWELYYETAFGPYTLGGWYLTSDGSMGVTNDGGLGGFLDFAPIEAVAVPAIQKMIKDNNLTGGGAVDPANCNHKWRDGVCAVCKTPCPHDEWKSGVCAACGYTCTHVGTHDADTMECSECGIIGHHTFVDGKCDCGRTTIFEMDAVPDEYYAECDQKGTVESFIYNTYAYAAEAADSSDTRYPVTKEALVYLPYGYDPTQSYDILYLLHGGGDPTADPHKLWLDTQTVNMLDNMIKNGECKPVIVVTPTFYSLVEGVEIPETGNYWTSEFGHELMNELIPAVEAKYASYAKGDVSAENLKATRAHRAYAGLSMGSMTSFNSVLSYCTDYFGYVGSYSAGPEAGSNEVTKAAVDKIAASLKASGNEIYYWFNGNGVKDMAHDPHLASYPYMLELLPELFEDGVNSCWVDYLEGIHDWVWWKLDLFNSLKVFFQVDEPGENPELEALAQQGQLR